MRYITQILTGKHIARSCEDVDETVLSAAQFKAAATDNPMVAQKMELENRVTELKILRGAWSNEQLSLERKISTIYPGQIKRYEDELSEKVAQLTEINTKLEFESLQESEVILDENGQRSDGEEDWDSERVPSCASAEV